MPASKPAPEPDSAPATAEEPKKISTTASAEPAAAAPAPDQVPEGRLPAGVYEYVWPIPTQYLAVPLTARPADPGREADGEDPGVPATPATVFHWPFSAPDDGRWQPSKKKPNTLPDNTPANPEE